MERESATNQMPILRTPLKTCYNEDDNIYEIGVDESGRGPLFGRV